jgi:hypothetical protein
MILINSIALLILLIYAAGKHVASEVGGKLVALLSIASSLDMIFLFH